MKTDFPPAFNPESFGPAAPGYRYTGRDENVRMDDEVNQTHGHGRWVSLINLGWSHGVTRVDSWTYRRALSVDDPAAPPPEQYSQPGYRVLTSDEMKGKAAEIGDQHWHTTYKTWCEANVGGAFNGTVAYFRRRTGVPTSQPIKPPSTMPTSVTPKVLIVSVPNAILSKAVQELAFEAGYPWVTSGKTLIDVPEGETILVHLTGSLQGYIIHSNRGVAADQKSYPGAIILNARSDLGMLIDLLAAAKAVPVAPKVNGYDASYLKGADTVSFGCAQIDLNMIRDAARAMSYIVDRGSIMENAGMCRSGNRQIASIVLSSGVSLTRDQVKAILTYVDEVNKLG